MKIAIISFTGRGIELSLRIKEALEEGHEIELFAKTRAADESNPNVRPVAERLAEWTKKYWRMVDALWFVGACGIAVRAIAPLVEDKLKDPAVLVSDELGQFVIPVLSGHVGGANELAREASEKMGALPVITTATDLHDVFAVDVFAKKKNLGIADRSGITAVSSTLLAGENVSVLLSPFEGERATLQLCPKIYVVGIGCRRGKTLPEIEAQVIRALDGAGIKKEALAALASIDKKADEEGIIALAQKYQVPFLTFSAQELSAEKERLGGREQLASSKFVEEQVGVDNVCESAALLAAARIAASREPDTTGAGKTAGSYELDGAVHLVAKKSAGDGVTVAIAKFRL